MMNNYQNLSNLTILISTLPEREKFLDRIINFFKNYNCKILIIGPLENFKTKKNTDKLSFIFYNKKKKSY